MGIDCNHSQPAHMVYTIQYRNYNLVLELSGHFCINQENPRSGSDPGKKEF